MRREALALVDPVCLLGALVHRQLETARRVLVVHRGCRGGLDEGGTGLDGEDLGAHVPRLWVLDGCGGDELLPALKDADGVVGLHGSVALLDDDELVVEEALVHVVEALWCQAGQQHDVFGGRELLDHFGDARSSRLHSARGRWPRAGRGACARWPRGTAGACSSPRRRSRARRRPSPPGRGDRDA